ncbi:MAG TPA: DUF2924 domain-containing protein [Hyphomicrobiales bacterium]|nr:DUF2924 domain-containing protein [Hyphomicrobiales bacterium]
MPRIGHQRIETDRRGNNRPSDLIVLDDRMEAELAHLQTLDLDGLRARWRSALGRMAPAHLSKPLLLRILSYRLQAECFGDLDPATVRLLDRVAREKGKSQAASVPLGDRDAVKPGAVLVREWEGQFHRVMALADGYAWNGSTYQSLSQVARAITGTRWNGPRFFGLRAKSGGRGASV